MGCVLFAFAASEFEVHPLFAVPGLVRGFQADGSRDSVERAVPQHFGHLLPWASPWEPHNGVTPEVGGILAKVKAASSEEVLCWSPVPPGGSKYNVRPLC